MSDLIQRSINMIYKLKQTKINKTQGASVLNGQTVSDGQMYYTWTKAFQCKTHKTLDMHHF